MKKTARLPSSEPAKRIAAIFHRKLTTAWSIKEIKTFRQLVKDGYLTDLDGLGLIERCYRMQWPPRRDKNILRHDLATFLNWYPTELDRATVWNELHPEKTKPRVIIPYSPPPSNEPPPVLSAEEEQRAAQFSAEMLRRNPNSKAFQRQLSSFQKVRQILEEKDAG